MLTMHYSNKQLTDEKEHNYRTHSQAIIPLKPLGSLVLICVGCCD